MSEINILEVLANNTNAIEGGQTITGLILHGKDTDKNKAFVQKYLGNYVKQQYQLMEGMVSLLKLSPGQKLSALSGLASEQGISLRCTSKVAPLSKLLGLLGITTGSSQAQIIQQ